MPYLNKVASLGKLLLCHIFVFFDVLLQLKEKKMSFSNLHENEKDNFEFISDAKRNPGDWRCLPLRNNVTVSLEPKRNSLRYEHRQYNVL